MNLIVTGSDGQLGTALKYISNKYSSFNWIFFNRSGFDITSSLEIENELTKFSNMKTILINCSAYTDVEKAESEPDRAYAVNSEGVRNLSEFCRETEIRLIHISTDFVFNGSKCGLYNETDEPDPVSVYGKTKLEGEKAVLENIKNCLIIRTSWLYSTTHNTFMNKIIQKSMTSAQLKVVNDEVGSPTYAMDLAFALADICETISINDNFKTEIYHFCNSGAVSRYDFAKKIIELADERTEIAPVKSEELGMKARRPGNSSLDNSKIKRDFGLKIRNWEDALTEAVRIINEQ